MAPDFVLHYIVTHEMVHLAVPEPLSLCPETERARQWLVTNGQRIQLMGAGAATIRPLRP
jgi:predicted metal-dependent hydrolase